MVEENKDQQFILEIIDETRDCFIEEIKKNELMSKKHKKVSTTLNYIEHLLILASAVTGCISISDFVSLVGIPVGVTISVVGLQICKITARIKTYNSITKKKKKKKRHDKIVLLAKTVK